MKKIILTIDYELFLGKETGTVKDCMIEPTEKLSSILEKNGSSMTVFWDILHYYRLLQLENEYPVIKEDKLLIEKQILNLAKKGFDIQLHLHPHWLDSTYENGVWNFNYSRFKLHNLSQENNPKDINTITGCVSITRKLIEELIRKEIKNYKVTSFRAGGYLIEPFEKLRNAFLINNINIDSSVCPGLYNENKSSPYDFRSYPADSKYLFDSTPKFKTENGTFIEIPVTTIKLSGFRNFYYKVLRKVKYPSLEAERKGGGVAGVKTAQRDSKTKNILASLLKSRFYQFTTDSNFREKFDFMFNKLPDNSTMILHPKLLNTHTIKLLDDYVSEDKIRFISIQNYLS
ncbi:MAG: hypothetical protein Q8M94_13025 [Ignavibacteria bacterium]|nr:hypothetical protein [Ignavibacteria bacterium]